MFLPLNMKMSERKCYLKEAAILLHVGVTGWKSRITAITISHTNPHTACWRRTFHNSKEPGGANILRKQHSLPVKLSQVDAAWTDNCRHWVR